MLSHERVTPVLLRKLLARVERDPERRGVRLKGKHREGDLLRRGFVRPVRMPRVPAGVIGEPEMHPGLGRGVELARRLIVAHVVGTVVGEMEDPCGRVEAEPDGVADAVGEGLHIAAVGIHPQDSPLRLLEIADVAGYADGHIEHPIRAETDVAPAVVHLVGQAIEDDLGLGLDRTVGREPVGSIPHDPVLLGDVEVSAVKRHAVRDLEALEQRRDGIRRTVPVPVPRPVDLAGPGADGNRPARGLPSQRAGPRHLGEDVDLEARRQVQVLNLGLERLVRRACRDDGEQRADQCRKR